jgi:hypothetical protein
MANIAYLHFRHCFRMRVRIANVEFRYLRIRHSLAEIGDHGLGQAKFGKRGQI